MNIPYSTLINQSHPLPASYVPDNLIDIGLPFDAPPGDSKRLLEKKTAKAAYALFSRACHENIQLYGISGYRSFSRQKDLFTGNPYIAAPGTSEHQSGLALDVSSPSVGLQLEEAFSTTKEGIWLAAHSPLYGFILRYPKNKEHITQIPFEPWHIRYVGKSLASYLSITGLTLEEFTLLNNEHSISL